MQIEKGEVSDSPKYCSKLLAHAGWLEMARLFVYDFHFYYYM